MSDSAFNGLQGACDALILSQHTLLLATRSSAGDAEISYAPFVRDGSSFYIFVSELAKHTQNLLAHPQAAVMFIEPEAEANNPFARKRLTFNCRAEEIDKSDVVYERQLQAMAGKFGDIVSVLRGLPDFHLLALAPSQGLFVAGFGKAMAVDADGRLQVTRSKN